MTVLHLEQLAILRTVVGYLGEREHFAWWQSGYFAPGSQAFLAPLFARTQLLAQCAGVTQAACLVHDSHIGIGDVYHLFRLPEDFEQGIHHTLLEPALPVHVAALIVGKESALAFLRSIAGTHDSQDVGPVRLGRASDLHKPLSLELLASHYHGGFTSGTPTYPYFAGEGA